MVSFGREASHTAWRSAWITASATGEAQASWGFFFKVRPVLQYSRSWRSASWNSPWNRSRLKNTLLYSSPCQAPARQRYTRTGSTWQQASGWGACSQ